MRKTVGARQGAFRRNSLKSLTLVGSLMLVVSGCSTSPDAAAPEESASPSSTNESVVLSFVGPETPESMQLVIDLFESEYPNITVEYESVPFGDLNSIISARVGSGDANPDIYTADQPRIAALVNAGLLLDITDEVGDISGLVVGSTIEASTVDGRLYALPISTSSQLLYFNKGLLDAAGIDHPSSDPENRLTWEELRRDAERVQTAGAEYGFLWDQVNRYYQLQPLMESLGGGSGVGPTELDIDITSEEWVTAMSFYGDMFSSGIAPRGVEPGETPDVFATGQTAFFVGGPWWLDKFVGSEGLDFGVAPHPYFESGEPVTPTGAWSWGINPNSDNVEEALLFIKFAALDENGSVATAQGFGLPPANLSSFANYYAANQTVAGVADLISYELENTSVIRPRTVGYIQLEEFLGTAFEDIRNGSDPLSSLEAAEESIKNAWSRIE